MTSQATASARDDRESHGAAGTIADLTKDESKTGGERTPRELT
jgi:hypothetical protein